MYAGDVTGEWYASESKTAQLGIPSVRPQGVIAREEDLGYGFDVPYSLALSLHGCLSATGIAFAADQKDIAPVFGTLVHDRPISLKGRLHRRTHLAYLDDDPQSYHRIQEGKRST